jgi:hypothetical protein
MTERRETETMSDHSLLQQFAQRQPVGTHTQGENVEPLIADEDLAAFLVATSPADGAELNDILERALSFSVQSRNQSLEVSFITLSAALESVLTFFRRQDEYKIMGAADFSEFERDLKKWLKQQPVLMNEPAKRALIYEKVPELNRFPYSHVFKKFCEHHSLDLSDLWPVIGKHADWPLTEIRHRLVHGDPFARRPPEAMVCAGAHLGWVVERMILCVLSWPIERSSISQPALRHYVGDEDSWKAERAKFA